MLRPAARFVVCALLCSLPSPHVWAQSGADATRVVLTETQAVVVGPPQILASPTTAVVAVRPEGRYVLAARMEAPLLPYTPSPGETGSDAPSPPVSIALWSSARERVSTVWQRTPEPASTVSVQSLDWLAGTATAVALVSTLRTDAQGTATASYEIVVVNAVQGGARSLLLPRTLLRAGRTPFVYLTSSPLQPLALLVCRFESEAGSPVQTMVYALRKDGSINSAPLATLSGDIFLGRWLANGKGVHGTRREAEAGSQTRKTIHFVLDLETGATRTLGERPTEKELLSDTNLPEPPKDSPLRAVTVPGRIAEGDAAPKVAPLSLVYLESKSAGTNVPTYDRRTLIAADARTAGSGMLPDGSAVLYYSRDTLFIAPLRTTDRAAFLAARRERMRRNMRANAMQIESALQQYAYDNQSGMPPAGSDIRSLLVGDKAYIRMDTGFRDPMTGELSLRYVYTGQPDSTGKTPLFTLRGAGGTLTMYQEAPPVWQDDAAPDQ